MTENGIKIVITRDDGIEGFAAYCAPSLTEENEGLVLLNIFATFMTGAIENENPVDILIENIMHEVGHALEEYFGKEFDEERIEGIVEKYRAIYEANKDRLAEGMESPNA